MNAEFTNALTNGLHALCLLMYFLVAARATQRDDERFTGSVVGIFLLIFVLKMLGVFVHYAPKGPGWAEMWVGIGLGLVLLHYVIMQTLRFPSHYRLMGLLFASTCTVLFLMRHDFIFLAVEILVFNLAAALYGRGLLRIGFAGVVLSVVVWIAARKGAETWLGGELPTAWRYDNDLFHFMLIASTFIIFRGFARGDGVPERFGAAVEEAETA